MTRIEFGEAYQSGLKRTIAFLLSMGIPNDAVNDVAQSAWARGWEHLAKLRDERMVLSWINTIALNYYRLTLRRQRREEGWNPAYEEISTEGLNLAAIDVKKILQASRPSDRKLLEAQLMGLTAHEIARSRGVTPTAIRIRLLRARRGAREICERKVALPQAA